jgi:hypothetical protein
MTANRRQDTCAQLYVRSKTRRVTDAGANVNAMVAPLPLTAPFFGSNPCGFAKVFRA